MKSSQWIIIFEFYRMRTIDLSCQCQTSMDLCAYTSRHFNHSVGCFEPVRPSTLTYGFGLSAFPNDLFLSLVQLRLDLGDTVVSLDFISSSINSISVYICEKPMGKELFIQAKLGIRDSEEAREFLADHKITVIKKKPSRQRFAYNFHKDHVNVQ